MAYSTSQAATLAGCSPQVLRANLAAGLPLLTLRAKPARGWTRVGAIDVSRIAVLRTLQEYGFVLHEGITALTASVDRYLVLHVTTVRDWSDLLRVLDGVTLRVTRTPSGITAALRFADSPWPLSEAAASVVVDMRAVAAICMARRGLHAPTDCPDTLTEES